MNRKIYKLLASVLFFTMPFLAFADGSGTLNPSFSLSKCGLNYTTATVRLGLRQPAILGVPQPAAFTIAGIPVGAQIEQAFLYGAGVNNGVPVTNTVTIFGPVGLLNFPATMIGMTPAACWGGYSNNVAYRADVTLAITGNGVYSISGLSTGAQEDISGATLFVIYSEPSSTIQGTINISDGALAEAVNTGPGVTLANTMTFPSVCGTPAAGKGFIIISDLQNPAPNTAGPLLINNTPTGISTDYFNFFEQVTTINGGQNSMPFSMFSFDCFTFIVEGEYHQIPNCTICNPPNVAFNVNTTPARCDRCDGTANVITTGLSCAANTCMPATYRYLWSNGDTTQFVSNLCAGSYTVDVYTAYDTISQVVNIAAAGHQFTIDSSVVVNNKCYQSCDGSVTAVASAQATLPLSYLWQPNLGTGPSINNLCVGNYVLTVTDSFGCFDRDTFAITQPGIVTPPYPSDVAYCQFDTAVALTCPVTTLGDSLLWYTTPTGGTGTVGPIPSTAASGIFLYYISEVDTATGCESPRVIQRVFVRPKPQMPVTFSPDVVYCFGDTTALPLVAIGDSLKWYTSPTGATYIDTAPVPITSILGVVTWYVSQTVNGCESDRLPLSWAIYEKPAPPITEDVTYCMFDTAAPLTAIGNDLKWYLAPVGGSPVPTPVPVTTTSDTATWYVASNNHGCESDRTPIRAFIKYRPTAHILHSSDSVCQFDSLVFNYSGNAHFGTSYFAWQWPTGAVVTQGDDTTRGPLVVRFDTVGGAIISLVVTDNGCSSYPAYDTVGVKRLPAPRIKITEEDACKNDTLQVGLDFVDMGIIKYSWYFDGGITPWGSSGVRGADGGGPFNITWPTEGIKDIQLFVQGSNNCFSLGTRDTINIHDRPAAQILPLSKYNICSGDSLRFSASTSIDGNRYEWTPAQFFDDGNNTAVANGYVEMSHSVVLKVTSPYGCWSEDSVYINTTPCCEIFLPTAFSPNGDGKNDVFRIVDKGRHPLSTFQVFNRWGQMIFNTANEKLGWDGSFEGTAQDLGVYFWVVKFKCDGKIMTKTGQVTLVR